MCRSNRALLGSALLALLAAPPAAGEPPRELVEWSEGPVRWLLLAPEEREMRQVGSSAEALAFIDRFWSRRDPDPTEPGNPYRTAFFQRVEASDLLYGEKGRRGSLTDRGRALIVLGSPSGLKIGSEPALRWEPRYGRRPKAAVENVLSEIWIYRGSDLPVILAQSLPEIETDGEIRLVFVQTGRKVRLQSGEPYLDLAARIALAKPSF